MGEELWENFQALRDTRVAEGWRTGVVGGGSPPTRPPIPSTPRAIPAGGDLSDGVDGSLVYLFTVLRVFCESSLLPIKAPLFVSGSALAATCPSIWGQIGGGG